jgi:hypothetical protein
MADFWLELEQDSMVKGRVIERAQTLKLDIETGMTFDERMAYRESFSSFEDRVEFERKQAQAILDAVSEGRLLSAIAQAQATLRAVSELLGDK